MVVFTTGILQGFSLENTFNLLLNQPEIFQEPINQKFLLSDVLVGKFCSSRCSKSSVSGEQMEILWRLNILNELLETRQNDTYLEGFNSDEITEMINSLCIS